MDAAAAEALIGLTGGGAGGGALQQQFSQQQQQQHYAGMMQHAGSEQLTTPMSATVRACVCAGVCNMHSETWAFAARSLSKASIMSVGAFA
jgi:hypothetical protein